MGEDFLLVALFQAFDDVGRVVRIELRHRLGENLVRQGLRDLVADAFVELGQNFVIKCRADRLDQLDALFRLEEFDDVGKIGGLEIAHEFGGARRFVAAKRVGDGTDQVRRWRPVRTWAPPQCRGLQPKRKSLRVWPWAEATLGRDRRSLQPAPIASELVARSRVGVDAAFQYRQILRLLSNRVGRGIRESRLRFPSGS